MDPMTQEKVKKSLKKHSSEEWIGFIGEDDESNKSQEEKTCEYELGFLKSEEFIEVLGLKELMESGKVNDSNIDEILESRFAEKESELEKLIKDELEFSISRSD